MNEFLVLVALIVPSVTILLVTVLFLRAIERTAQMQKATIEELAVYIKSPDIQTAIDAQTIKKYNEKQVDVTPPYEEVTTLPDEIQLDDGRNMKVYTEGDKDIFQDSITGDKYERIW